MLNLDGLSPIQNNKTPLSNPKVAKSPNRATEPSFGSNKSFATIPQKLLGHMSGVKVLTPQEKEALRLENAVFRPLDKFMGPPEAFAKKAYETLIDFYGLQDVKPRLTLDTSRPESVAASFFPSEGSVKISPETLNYLSKGDILDTFAHELDHFQKYGDILCEIGFDEFQKQLIGTPQQFTEQVRKNPPVATKMLHQQNILLARLPSYQRMNLSELQKEIQGNPLSKRNWLQNLFPDDAAISNRSAILNKITTFIHSTPGEACYIISQKQNQVDRPFWQNYLDKKLPSYTHKYDVAPFLKGFITLRNDDILTPYKEMLDIEEYLARPMEQTAWETGINMLKSWNKFKGLPANEYEKEDMRIENKLFQKIDKKVATELPNEYERANFFNHTFSKTMEEIEKRGETPTYYEILGKMAQNLGVD